MTTSARIYAGVEGDQRKAERRAQLIEAGLDLLGGPDGETAFSVRGVCKSFADREALAVAVYEHAVGRIAESALRAVAEAPQEERALVRAVVAILVQEISDDPRLGRLVFFASLNNMLAQQRLESVRMFVGLTIAQAVDFYDTPSGPELDLVGHFVVGGLAQILTAWLDGAVEVDTETLIERCTDLMIAAGSVR
jgi:AcrR family transcriptional regulator